MGTIAERLRALRDPSFEDCGDHECGDCFYNRELLALATEVEARAESLRDLAKVAGMPERNGYAPFKIREHADALALAPAEARS